MGVHPAAIILPIAIFAALPAQSATLSFSGKAYADGWPGERGYCAVSDYYGDCRLVNFPLGERNELNNVLIDYSYRVEADFMNASVVNGDRYDIVEAEREYVGIANNMISGSIGLYGNDTYLEPYYYRRLCCTKPLGDSSRESSVIAGWHEQTDTPDLQDQELAGL